MRFAHHVTDACLNQPHVVSLAQVRAVHAGTDVRKQIEQVGHEEVQRSVRLRPGMAEHAEEELPGNLVVRWHHDGGLVRHLEQWQRRGRIVDQNLIEDVLAERSYELVLLEP